MKNVALGWAVLFALALAIGSFWMERSSGSSPAADAVEPANHAIARYELVRVLDGDSLVLRDGQSREIEVRIHAIDAPERGQPFSSVSRNHLRDLLREGAISLVERDRDQYGRTVARLSVDGLDVGLEQVRSGMAWYYRRYQSAQPLVERALYEKAEASARNERLGLWDDEDPIQPEHERRSRRR